MDELINPDLFVAPCAGAWIEIRSLRNLRQDKMSLPVRERGLKYCGIQHEFYNMAVAPCAGAWIEINTVCRKLQVARVAPCAGAWIEIRAPSPAGGYRSVSLPVRERGLKFFAVLLIFRVIRSLPVRERGLKLMQTVKDKYLSESLPVRERGLKCTHYCLSPILHRSLPVRERGLK